jgi:hypothetical protein
MATEQFHDHHSPSRRLPEEGRQGQLDQAADEFNRICAEQFGGVDPDLSDSDLAQLEALEQEERYLSRSDDEPPYPRSDEGRRRIKAIEEFEQAELAQLGLGWKAIAASGE